jgi:adenosylmethionine---8-amino-7-oxononanoate aminotransferase
MYETLSMRDQKIIWHPFTQAKIAPAPVAISKASGSYLYTDQGQKLFDGVSSWWTTVHGHCHPVINQAIRDQLEKLEHVIFSNFTHEPGVELGELLTGVLPKELKRVFYSDNGSTDVEVAIKMAYQYWQHRQQQRPYFIVLEHGYHGDTFGAMSISERSVFTKPFWPLLFNVIKTKSTCQSEITEDKSENEITKDALSHLASLLHQHQNQIAGVIIEPMLQGSAGMKIFTKGFLSGIKKLCVDSDTLLIVDEVLTGFYRTGKFFACHYENVVPDIICLAKGLTGGYLPLGATVAREEIFQAFCSDRKADALMHGHTFTANPLACAAAIASIKLLHEDDVVKNILAISHGIEMSMHDFKNIPSVKHVRNIGAIAVIELDDQDGYLSLCAADMAKYCFDRGLFIRPLGNVVYLMPPLCTTPQEIIWALSLIKEALISCTKNTNHRVPSYG